MLSRLGKIVAAAGPDGFRVAPGCSATIAYLRNVGPGWLQVHDDQEIFVTDYRC
jgi:hypothetical protein